MSRKLVFFVSLIAFSLNEMHPIEAAGDGKNKRVVQALCNIYNQALDLEAQPNVTASEKVPKMFDEIELINMSTLADESFNGKSVAPYAEDQWKNKIQAFGEKVQTLDGAEHTFRRMSSRASATAAQVKIGRILRKAEVIQKEYQGTVRKANDFLESARIKVREALYGPKQTKLGTESFSTDRDTGCGHAATAGVPAAGSGMSLLNDFVCLCAKGNANPDGLACATTAVALPSSWGSGGDTETKQKALDAWTADVSKLCPARRGMFPTPGTLRSAVENYFTFIQSGTGGAGFVVGHSDGTGACGKKASADIACVAYPDEDGNEAAPGAKKAPLVKWASAAIEAARKLKNAEREEETLPRLENQLFTLHQQAWNIYADLENDNEGSHAENKKGTLNAKEKPTTPERATAHETTAVNAAAVPRFVLPWTLLI